MSHDIERPSCPTPASPVVFKLPPWRNALSEFVAAGFSYGDEIKHEWFHSAMHIVFPKAEDLYASGHGPSISELRDWSIKLQDSRLEYASQMELLKEALSNDHKFELVSIPGFGYRVMTPGEQFVFAENDHRRIIKNSTRKALRRIVNTNTSLLSSDELHDHAQCLTRVSSLSVMLSSKKSSVATIENKKDAG